MQQLSQSCQNHLKLLHKCTQPTSHSYSQLFDDKMKEKKNKKATFDDCHRKKKKIWEQILCYFLFENKDIKQGPTPLLTKFSNEKEKKSHF